MIIVSITLRGFAVPARDIVGFLMKEVSHFGDVGDDYRGHKGKRLRKSYVYIEEIVKSSDDIGSTLRRLIGCNDEAGSITIVKDKFNISDIGVNIHLGLNDLERESGFSLEPELMKEMVALGAFLGFSWSIG